MAQDSGGGEGGVTPGLPRGLRPRLGPAPGTFIDRRPGGGGGGLLPVPAPAGGLIGRLGGGIRVPNTGQYGGIQRIRDRARGKGKGKGGGRKGRRGRSK